MSSRNGSYARIVDAMSKRSKSEKQISAPANSNEKPSPETARSDFDAVKKTAPNVQTKRDGQQFGPSPERKLQPKGMGERGVNWQAHIKRAGALRDQQARPRDKQARAPKGIAAKAQKAALQKRKTSTDFQQSR